MLLRHSFVMLFGNFAIALRLSAVLYAVQAISLFYFKYFMPNITFLTVVVLVPAAIAYLWIIVAWHRFILLEEEPIGVFPEFHGQRLWNYFWEGLLLYSLLVIALVVLFLIFYFTPSFLPQLKMLIYALIIVLVGSVLFRFAAVLPAAALGERLTWSAAWRATRGSTGSMILITLVLYGGCSLADWLVKSLFLGNLFLLALWDIPFHWFGLMIHISILTTLYGHYVEKRALG